MKLNKFQIWIATLFRITPFHINKALWSSFRKGIEITEKKYKEQVEVHVDPTFRTAAYDQPSPRTDPVLHIRLEEQRKKNEMKAFLDIDDSRELPKVSGDVVRRWNTQKLERLDMLEVTEPRVRKVHLVTDDEKEEWLL